MSAPAYNNIIVELFSQIDVLTRQFTMDAYQALAKALAAPLGALGVLAIVLMGYGIARGIIRMSMDVLYGYIIRIGIIWFFAMNWGNFSTYFVDLFAGGASQLGAVLMKATHMASPEIAGKNIAHSLQSVFSEIVEVGNLTLKKAGMRHVGPFFVSLLIYIAALAIALAALFEIVVAKLMLSLCLCTAPLFFLFTLFEKTRGFFDRWLGSLVGFSLVLVLVSAVLGLGLSLVHWSVKGHLLNQGESVGMVAWIPIFIVAALCVGAVIQAAGIAKNIGGGCHTAGGAAMVGAFMGSIMGTGRFASRLGRSTKKAGELGRKGLQKSGRLLKAIHNGMPP